MDDGAVTDESFQGPAPPLSSRLGPDSKASDKLNEGAMERNAESKRSTDKVRLGASSQDATT
jgi:hypothetical protein